MYLIIWLIITGKLFARSYVHHLCYVILIQDFFSLCFRHDALLTLRCVLLQNTDPDKWKSILDMQSHMECREPGTEAYE